jgi:hypothetical protein
MVAAWRDDHAEARSEAADEQVAEAGCLEALEVARQSLPPYSATHSPKLFTQHQLFAVAVLRQFFRTDFRGIAAILADSSDLRDVLGLKRVPHFSTLFYAEQRLSRGGSEPPADRYGESCVGEGPAAEA